MVKSSFMNLTLRQFKYMFMLSTFGILSALATSVEAAENDFLANGQHMYESECSSCHGDFGRDETGLFQDIDQWSASMTVQELNDLVEKKMAHTSMIDCGTQCTAQVTAYIAAGFRADVQTPDGIPGAVKMFKVENQIEDLDVYRTNLSQEDVVDSVVESTS